MSDSGDCSLSSRYRYCSQTQLNGALHKACIHNDLPLVRHLLSSKQLQRHADIHANHSRALATACYHGHLDIVKYLLTSTELSEHADIHAKVDWPLLNACIAGELEVVKYLLASPELLVHASVNNRIFPSVCHHGHLEVLQYLLAHPGVQDIPKCDWGIAHAHLSGHKKVVDFLLYDMGVVVRSEALDMLTSEKKQELIALGERRDLFVNLNTQLHGDASTGHKNKDKKPHNNPGTTGTKI